MPELFFYLQHHRYPPLRVLAALWAVRISVWTFLIWQAL